MIQGQQQQYPKTPYDSQYTLVVGPFSADVKLEEVTRLFSAYRINRAMITFYLDDRKPENNPFWDYCALIEFNEVTAELSRLCKEIFKEWMVILPANRPDGVRLNAAFLLKSKLCDDLKKAWGVQIIKPAAIERITFEDTNKPQPQQKSNHVSANNKNRNPNNRQRSSEDSNDEPITLESLDADLDRYRAEANSMLPTTPPPQCQPQQNHNLVSANNNSTRNSNNKRGSRKGGAKDKVTPESLDADMARYHAQAPKVTTVGTQSQRKPIADPSVNDAPAKNGKKNRSRKSKKPTKNGGKRSPKASYDVIPAEQRKAKSASADVVSPLVGFDSVDTVVDEWAEATDVAYISVELVEEEKVVDEWAEATDVAIASVEIKEEEKVVDEWAEATDVANASVELKEVETVVDEWAEAEVETDHASDGEDVVDVNVFVGIEAMSSDVEVGEAVAGVAEGQCESLDSVYEHINVEIMEDCKDNEGINMGELLTDSVPLQQMLEIENEPSDTTRDMEETLVSSVTDGVKDVERSCDLIMDCKVITDVEAVATELAKEVVELVEKVDEESDHGEVVYGVSCGNVFDNMVDTMVVSLNEAKFAVEIKAVAAKSSTEVADVVTSGVDEKLEDGDDGVMVWSDDVVERVDVEFASVDVDGFKSEECGEVELVAEFMEDEGKVVMMTGAETSAELS
ncbi:hypothetical protein HDU76_011109, partial [Blyttiomyces sp. JEL0837]